MEEFLNELRELLLGEITPGEINDTISYYREYFVEERSHGKTDQEIIASIGSARLIARSIIDAKAGQIDRGANASYTDADAGEDYETYDTSGNRMNRSDRKSGFGVVLENGLRKAGCLIIAVAVIVLVFFLARTLLPVVLLFALVSVIVNFFTKRR